MMNRLLRLLLALLGIAVVALATLSAPVSADDEDGGDGCRKECDEETTTTTAAPDPTTTEAPTTTTTEDRHGDDDETATTTTTTEPEPESTTTTVDRERWWERRRTTTTTTTTVPPTTQAPQPVFVGGAASTDRVPAGSTRIRLTDTTFVEAVDVPPETLAPLSYEPVERTTTTRPPVDRSDLETALASTQDTERSSGVLGISDTILALVLGAIAVVLLGTGGMRRWLDR